MSLGTRWIQSGESSQIRAFSASFFLTFIKKTAKPDISLQEVFSKSSTKSAHLPPITTALPPELTREGTPR
jgi:hypothetical protein